MSDTLGVRNSLPPRNAVHRLYELRWKIGFQDEAKGSGIEDPTHHLVGLVHGEDNNFAFWTVFLESGASPEARPNRAC